MIVVRCITVNRDRSEYLGSIGTEKNDFYYKRDIRPSDGVKWDTRGELGHRVRILLLIKKTF